MSVDVPTQMVEAWAKNAPDCTQAAQVPGGKVVPFPVPSQVAAGFPGNASLDTGFTPANMTPLNKSGLPMSGPDLQGALFLISGPSAAVSAGQLYFPFSDTYATAIGGYALGAVVQDATNVLQKWVSAVADNDTDPAVHPENWVSSVPLHSSSAPTAGTHTDNTLAGPSDFIVDVDTTAGNITLNGFVSQRDGQRVTVCNTGANLLVLGFLAGTAANQIRANGSNVTILQNDSFTFQYCAAISRWVAV